MCGGTSEIFPCYYVRHIIRKRGPYKWKTVVNVIKENSIRLVPKFGWTNTKTTTMKDSTMIWQNMGHYREGKTWDSV